MGKLWFFRLTPFLFSCALSAAPTNDSTRYQVPVIGTVSIADNPISQAKLSILDENGNNLGGYDDSTDALGIASATTLHVQLPEHFFVKACLNQGTLCLEQEISNFHYTTIVNPTGSVTNIAPLYFEINERTTLASRYHRLYPYVNTITTQKKIKHYLGLPNSESLQYLSKAYKQSIRKALEHQYGSLNKINGLFEGFVSNTPIGAGAFEISEIPKTELAYPSSTLLEGLKQNQSDLVMVGEGEAPLTSAFGMKGIMSSLFSGSISALGGQGALYIASYFFNFVGDKQGDVISRLDILNDKMDKVINELNTLTKNINIQFYNLLQRDIVGKETNITNTMKQYVVTVTQIAHDRKETISPEKLDLTTLTNEEKSTFHRVINEDVIKAITNNADMLVTDYNDLFDQIVRSTSPIQTAFEQEQYTFDDGSTISILSPKISFLLEEIKNRAITFEVKALMLSLKADALGVIVPYTPDPEGKKTSSERIIDEYNERIGRINVAYTRVSHGAPGGMISLYDKADGSLTVFSNCYVFSSGEKICSPNQNKNPDLSQDSDFNNVLLALKKLDKEKDIDSKVDYEITNDIPYDAANKLLDKMKKTGHKDDYIFPFFTDEKHFSGKALNKTDEAHMLELLRKGDTVYVSSIRLQLGGHAS